MYLSASDITDLMDGLGRRAFQMGIIERDVPVGEWVGLAHLALRLIQFAPGDRSEIPRSEHHQEAFIYVLSGCGVTVLVDEIQEIGPGDFIGSRLGNVRHTIFNYGDEPLLCLVVGSLVRNNATD